MKIRKLQNHGSVQNRLHLHSVENAARRCLAHIAWDTKAGESMDQSSREGA